MTVPAEVEPKLKENPYLILCHDCGHLICYKCAQFEDHMSGEGYDDCSACRRLLKAKSRQYKRHLATFDHSNCDGNDGKVVMTWRLS